MPRAAIPKCAIWWTRDAPASVAPRLLNRLSTTVSGRQTGLLAQGGDRRTIMLTSEQAQRLFELAVNEFAPDWAIDGRGAELSLNNPDHWPSGIGTFGFVVRHRITGITKVLGWRRSSDTAAHHYRGVSFRVLEAYADRNTDPIKRYLQEIGALGPSHLSARALVS
jgi:hypothetical protein